ncbi:hypothetical protein GF337_19525 [candidate division KSB1 bacterium]|nr:hypothetical protein [candidate division KSB1 bacterium]
MLRVLKITIGLLIVFGITAIVVLILSLRLARNSLPKEDGTVKLYGLRSTCNIYRDAYGVPHILARNEEDMFFALGYAHAQDRLWQMDFHRRAATGRLSEIYGERTIRSDKFFRTIGLHETAQNIATNLTPESRNMLFHYIAGINNYINRQYENLPIEFAQLNYKPESWKIEDIIALHRLIAWEQSKSCYYDLVIGNLVEKCGYRKVNELYPGYLKTQSPYLLNQLTAAKNVIMGVTDFIFKLPRFGFSIDANQMFSVDSSKTITGKSLLAFAPIQKPALPSNWYEVHLVAPFINGYGLSVPGLPVLLCSFNDQLAWNLAPLNADDLDFRIEQVDSFRYYYQYEWHPMGIRNEVINIKNRKQLEFKVRITKHGPLVSDLLDMGDSAGIAISVNWTGHKLTDDFAGIYHLLKAKSENDLRSAVRTIKVPAYQILYADTLNNIELMVSGLIAKREAGETAIPVPGWNSRYDWSEFMTERELDRLTVRNVNTLLADHTGNRRLNALKTTSFLTSKLRNAHLFSRIDTAGTLTVEKIKDIQNDIHSLQAKKLLPHFLQVLETLPVHSDLQNYFVDELQQWNFSMDGKEIAPTIYNACVVSLIKNIFRDEMGDSLFYFYSKLPEVSISALSNIDKTSWINNSATPETETFYDIILKSLDDAYQYLILNHGDIVDNWRWGKVHKMNYVHEIGKSYPEKWVFNIESVSLDGSNCTINNSGYEMKRLFNVAAITTNRVIIDLGDIEGSQIIFSTGQSGQPLDEHYKDQFALWKNGQYRSITYNQEKIQHSGYNLLILKPN